MNCNSILCGNLTHILNGWKLDDKSVSIEGNPTKFPFEVLNSGNTNKISRIFNINIYFFIKYLYSYGTNILCLS